MEESKKKKRLVHDNIHFYPMEYITNAYELLFYYRLAEDTIMVEKDYLKESLHNERQLA